MFLSKESPFLCEIAKWDNNAPAKESPQPVGSIRVTLSQEGDSINPSGVKAIAPFAALFITMNLGPGLSELFSDKASPFWINKADSKRSVRPEINLTSLAFD